MQLDKVAAVIRPRNPWEAIDLGFLMARRWWRPLLLSWLAVALPIMVLATVLFHWSPWIGPLLFWWLKPLYEQAPLLLLSRALFDDMPDRRAIVREAARPALKQALLNITWRRFDPMRSFNAPVAQLEGLSGKPRQERLGILQYGQGAATWLTIIAAHFEVVIYASFYALIMLLIPAELLSEAYGIPGPDALAGSLLQNGFYFMAAGIIAPFYVAGGFALYLNRRVSLEGWDIELAFKRLQQRTRPRPVIREFAMAALLGSLLVTSSFNPGHAGEHQVTPDEARLQIESILAGEDFSASKTEQRWVYIGDEDDSEPPADSDWDLEWLIALGNFLSQIFELLLWIAVGLIVFFVVTRFSTWRHWIRLCGPHRPQAARQAVPATLFGLAVTEESLPADLIGTVTEKYVRGDCRGALSLLYRGSLTRLMVRDNIIFSSGFTEGECIALVEHRHPSKPLIAFFRELTHHWMRMAYAHRPPDLDTITLLCTDWPAYFERTPPAQDTATHA